MFRNYFSGLKYAFKGFALINNKGIRRYAFVPLLVNISIFSFAIYTGFTQFDSWMHSLLGSISWLPDWLEKGITWVLLPLFTVLILIATYYTFTVIANLIAAPFNSMLAYKVEQHLRGTVIAEGATEQSVMSVMGRTLSSEAKKLAHMLKWLIALLIITIIPGLNVIAPFAWMVYGAWMLSLEYADYPMSNHDMFFKDEVGLLKKNRFLSLGFGSGVMLLTVIPIVNFFAMPVSVAASTALWVDRLSD